MVDMKEEIKALASYLCVSCGQLSTDSITKAPSLKISDKDITGLATIAKHLTRQSTSTDLLGLTTEDQCQVNEWLEYRVSHVDRCQNQQDVYDILKELNTHLKTRVYMVGCHLTLADIVLFYGLHIIMNGLTFYEKQKFMHVSRWFNQVQHQNGLQPNIGKITFMKTNIYTSTLIH